MLKMIRLKYFDMTLNDNYYYISVLYAFPCYLFELDVNMEVDLPM